MTGSGDSPEATRRAATPEVVEYCAHNVRESRTAVEALPAETRCYPCLERCGRCRRRPFLVADGEVVDAESHAALVELLAPDRDDGTPEAGGEP